MNHTVGTIYCFSYMLFRGRSIKNISPSHNVFDIWPFVWGYELCQIVSWNFHKFSTDQQYDLICHVDAFFKLIFDHHTECKAYGTHYYNIYIALASKWNIQNIMRIRYDQNQWIRIIKQQNGWLTIRWLLKARFHHTCTLYHSWTQNFLYIIQYNFKLNT